jgi:7-cyano-7-deazaguanine synthase
MGSKAVILLSGGIDSATAMWKVKEKYSPLYALTFTYGTKDEEVMLKVTKRLAGFVDAIHKVITLPWLEELSKISESALISEEKEVPTPREPDLDDQEKALKTARAVWVPARNLVFISIAASFADAIGGDVDIITGFDREEAETFSDNSLEFVKNINKVLEFGVLNRGTRVLAPLIDLNKDEIAGLAIKLGVPIEYTSSCYTPMGLDKEGRPVHCGRCESCMRRKRGFKVAGGDRTVYKV